MERETEGIVVMRTWKMDVSGHRKIGRPKLRRSEATENETGVRREEA